MPDYNLGTGRGRIKVDYDNSGVAAANKGFQSVQREGKQTKQVLGDVGTASGAASATLAAGLVYAASKAIDFQKQISAIGAVSGATSDELEQMRKKALQLGADTSFSATEAASAMEELAKAGVSVKDILNGAADAAVALAAAGGIDLATAAEIAANAMGQFNLKAKDLGEVVDYIAGAANASAISVIDFNESMKQAGAVANLAGLKFEDLATAIALMGQNGIKGSDAGTSLKTMLSNLQPTTRGQIKLMRELGLVTKDGANAFYDAQGNIKSLSEISGILNTALKNQTAQQKSLTLETLFGSDAIRAAAILTKAGAEGFDKMNAAINATKASDVAKARLDNVAGSIEQMKGAAETAAITLGTLFLPYIRKVAEFITKLTNKFNGLDPKWQKLIGFAIAGAAALLGVIAAVSAIGFAFIGLGAALATIKIAAIVTLIVGAIAAIVAGFVLLYKKSLAFRTAIATIFAVMAEHFRALVKVVQPFVDYVKNTLIPAIRDGLRKAVENMRPAFEAIASFFRDKVAPTLKQFREAIVAATPTLLKIGKALATHLGGALALVGKVLGTVIPILLKVAGVIFPALGAAISFLIRNIPTFVKIIQFMIGLFKTVGTIIAVALIGPFYALWKAGVFVFNALKAASQFFADLWKKVFAFIAPIALAAFDKVKSALAAIANVFKAVFNFILPLVKSVFGLIGSIIGAAMSVIKAIISTVWTIVSSIFKTALAIIVGLVKPKFDAMVAIIQAVMTFLGKIISEAWAYISEKFMTGVNAVVGAAKWFWEGVTGAFNAAINVVRPLIQGFIDFFVNLWKTVTAFVSGVVSAFWEKIKALFSAAVARVIAIIDGIKAMVDKVKAFFNQLKAAADGGTGTLIAFVKQIPGKVLDALGNLGATLYDKGKALIQGLIDGIKAMLGKLRDAAKSVASAITDWLPGSPAKKGPLSGQGYSKIRGEHLAEDFAVGIMLKTSEAERAISRMLDGMAAQLPAPVGDVLSNQLLGTAAPTGAGAVATLTRAEEDAPVTIEQLNIAGVWDFNDPLETRRVAKEVAKAIDDFKKGYN